MAARFRGVIAIIGTTGVGKSKLAIELARHLSGEVINADSLQVYKGYDIITNKVSEQEMQGVPHHLLGFLETSRQYTVQEFETDSLKLIEEVLGRGKVPILVGGTHYYIQSILFKKSLITGQSRVQDNQVDSIDSIKDAVPKSIKPIESSKYLEELEKLSGEELLQRLQDVDPKMALRWHPNDRRKIIRSLQVFYDTGKPHSEWVSETEKDVDNSLRFPSLVFWLYSKPDILNSRLIGRANEMISRGLFDEVNKFMAEETKSGQEDKGYSFGIRQAIGFKEFEEYCRYSQTEEQDPKKLQELKDEGIQAMKSNNIKYAKKQLSWIRNKLLPVIVGSGELYKKAHVYVMDATDLNEWNDNVCAKACKISNGFISNKKELPSPFSISEIAKEVLLPLVDNQEVENSANRLDRLLKIKCEVCSYTSKESKDGVEKNYYVFGNKEYLDHLKTRKHKKNIKYRKMLEFLRENGKLKQ